MASSSSRRRSSSMRASRSSIRLPSAVAPGPGSDSCSHTASARSAGRAAGPRRARSGAPRCRSTPRRRSRGSGGGARPAASPRRCRRWDSAGPACGRASCGRRPPRGGGRTRRRARSTRVLGLPTSWKRAARRRMRSGLVFSTTAMVWARTSLWRCTGSCSRASADSSGRNSSERPVRTRNHRPSAGRSTTTSRSSSSRMRSGDTIDRRPCICSTAPTQLGLRDQAVAGDEPRRPQHAQRIVAERLLRCQRRAQPPQ